MDTFQPTLWSVDCLTDFWTKNLGDGDAFRRTRIDRWNKCQFLHPFITWPIYQQRRGDAYRQTKIDGWRGQAVSISNPRHQYSPINWSIDQFIDLSLDGQNICRDTSLGQQTEGHIVSTDINYASTVRMVIITDITQSQKSQLSPSQKSQISIFHSIIVRAHWQKVEWTEMDTP